MACQQTVIKPIKSAFFIITIFLLSGCGFHLRGMVDMPTWLDNVAIIVQNGHRDLEPLLKEQLDAYHIHVCAEFAKAKYWLIIEHDYEEQHITSVSSSTTPRQYQMTYTVRYKLQQASGKEIIPLSNAVSTRQLTVNSNRILGSNDEEEILKREMRKDTVIQMIDRIGNKAA